MKPASTHRLDGLTSTPLQFQGAHKRLRSHPAPQQLDHAQQINGACGNLPSLREEKSDGTKSINGYFTGKKTKVRIDSKR